MAQLPNAQFPIWAVRQMITIKHLHFMNNIFVLTYKPKKNKIYGSGTGKQLKKIK